MKDRFILFVIGVLVGAVIATGAFYVYTITTKSCDCSSNNTQNQPPIMLREQNSENGQPPAKPGEDNTQDSNN